MALRLESLDTPELNYWLILVLNLVHNCNKQPFNAFQNYVVSSPYTRPQAGNDKETIINSKIIIRKILDEKPTLKKSLSPSS